MARGQGVAAMADMVWKEVVGQQRILDTLGNAFRTDALGHAYLFSGAAGVGKMACALELGRALLCESNASAPCDACESCRQVKHYAHPDFRMIMPVALQKEHKSSDGKLSEEGWRHLTKLCRNKLAHPYSLSDWPGIPSMPVEWIREVNHAILRGSIKGRRNVAIISDVDMMRQESANAMLKTLEEPPAGTVIILLTERIHAVLPTILSRCQIIRFGYVSNERIREALARCFNIDSGDSRIVQATESADGSLGKALRLFEQPLNELIEEAHGLWELSCEPDWLRKAGGIDSLLARALDNGRDYRSCEKILTYAGDLVRDSFLSGVHGSEKYIRKEFISSILSNRSLSAEKAGKALAICQQAAAGARSRGNLLMILVAFMIQIDALLAESDDSSRQGVAQTNS